MTLPDAWKEFPSGFRVCRRCYEGINQRARWKQYGLTEEQYFAMLEAQNFSCLLCLRSESEFHRWAIDHDHKCCPGPNSCGECVRGLLCHKCNLQMVALDNWDDAQLGRALRYAGRADTWVNIASLGGQRDF